MNLKGIVKYKELLIGMVVGLCAIAYLIGSMFIRRTTIVALGAEFMPQVYGFILLGLSALQVIVGINAAKKYEPKKEPTDSTEKPDNKSVFITFGLILLYVASMKILGYTISSILFLFSLTYVLTPVGKKKNYRTMIIFSVVLPLITSYLFRNVMHLGLPIGFLGI
ncbi:Tripartite tricarboxylate transporter TctB family protein [Anaerovirgula multivorans]|uniref:Tripartite tricarboxylate transporter TctB family protein n=1 Tax=Anaerovirgula multivorans TaxID=312168 RepID=A0A239B9W2_9FIRM|nr:tripartite tricarboxylate transporter TctB family protein [Anaerovirgula multivorans]SNS04489.1 Tripartite tricarboxylate transporter TctB family protein [Anaerovirgula multivorans]